MARRGRRRGVSGLDRFAHLPRPCGRHRPDPFPRMNGRTPAGRACLGTWDLFPGTVRRPNWFAADRGNWRWTQGIRGRAQEHEATAMVVFFSFLSIGSTFPPSMLFPAGDPPRRRVDHGRLADRTAQEDTGEVGAQTGSARRRSILCTSPKVSWPRRYWYQGAPSPRGEWPRDSERWRPVRFGPRCWRPRSCSEPGPVRRDGARHGQKPL